MPDWPDTDNWNDGPGTTSITIFLEQHQKSHKNNWKMLSTENWIQLTRHDI